MKKISFSTIDFLYVFSSWCYVCVYCEQWAHLHFHRTLSSSFHIKYTVEDTSIWKCTSSINMTQDEAKKKQTQRSCFTFLFFCRMFLLHAIMVWNMCSDVPKARAIDHNITVVIKLKMTFYSCYKWLQIKFICSRFNDCVLSLLDIQRATFMCSICCLYSRILHILYIVCLLFCATQLIVT